MVDYVNNQTKVKIKCNECQTEFEQTPGKHLLQDRKGGCPKCLKQFSKVQIQWLEHIMKKDGVFIQHALNGGEFKIPGTRYSVDGYCKETNTVYEFHGDFFHGNPDVYPPDFYNRKVNLTMGKLYERTMKKEKHLADLEYTVKSIWERDWKLERDVMRLKLSQRMVKLVRCAKKIVVKCKEYGKAIEDLLNLNNVTNIFALAQSLNKEKPTLNNLSPSIVKDYCKKYNIYELIEDK
jgi:hypothetical protein